MAKIAVEHIEEEQQAPEAVQEVNLEEGLQIDKKRRPAAWAVLVLVLAAGLITYQILNRDDTNTTLNDSSSTQQTPQLTESEELHQKLSQSLDLPNETPNLATVMDAKKVKDQLFFSKAENGDKVLIYVNAGQAVLYRPTTGKVINLAPIQLDAKASQGVR